MMKVSANDVHRLLREFVGRELSQLGYVALRGSSFAMQKPEGDKYVVLWAQCDKYGWDDIWGSSFTIELQFSNSPKSAGAGFLERARFAHLLSEDELEQVRELNNAVITTLPGHLAGKAIKMTDAEGNESTIVGCTPSLTKYAKGWDVWLHYAALDHLSDWSKLLSQLLPACIPRLQSKVAD